MPTVRVTRRVHFSAAHRLHNPEFSETRNREIFGLCNNPNWHGHNYVLEVSVRGQVEQRTGYVLDLARLKEVVTKEIVDKVDHRNLNLDVEFMHGIIPTTENLVVGIWKILQPAIAPAELALLRLWESENNRVEYTGE